MISSSNVVLEVETNPPASPIPSSSSMLLRSESDIRSPGAPAMTPKANGRDFVPNDNDGDEHYPDLMTQVSWLMSSLLLLNLIPLLLPPPPPPYPLLCFPRRTSTGKRAPLVPRKRPMWHKLCPTPTTTTTTTSILHQQSHERKKNQQQQQPKHNQRCFHSSVAA